MSPACAVPGVFVPVKDPELEPDELPDDPLDEDEVEPELEPDDPLDDEEEVEPELEPDPVPDPPELPVPELEAPDPLDDPELVLVDPPEEPDVEPEPEPDVEPLEDAVPGPPLDELLPASGFASVEPQEALANGMATKTAVNEKAREMDRFMGEVLGTDFTRRQERSGTRHVNPFLFTAFFRAGS